MVILTLSCKLLERYRLSKREFRAWLVEVASTNFGDIMKCNFSLSKSLATCITYVTYHSVGKYNIMDDSAHVSKITQDDAYTFRIHHHFWWKHLTLSTCFVAASSQEVIYQHSYYMYPFKTSLLDPLFGILYLYVQGNIHHTNAITNVRKYLISVQICNGKLLLLNWCWISNSSLLVSNWMIKMSMDWLLLIWQFIMVKLQLPYARYLK